jgi:uncharacterized membrane protein YgcG
VAVFRRHVEPDAGTSRDAVRDANNAWLYYYLILNSSNRPVYYVSSSTPIIDFRTVTFTKVGEKLPSELEEAVENGEQLGNVRMEPEEEPTEVEAEMDTTQEQIEAMESQGGPAAPESEAEGSTSDSSSTSESSSSSDSGSSSGGGDSGGGGGDGGGGGGD